MAPTPEIQLAVDTAIARGIGRRDVAPPLHRLLWAMGVDARPPHYASFGCNALLMGGFWGAWMAIFFAACALHLHPEAGAGIVVQPVCMALLAAVAFGLAMAAVFRARARKANLPAWDELGVPGR